MPPLNNRPRSIYQYSSMAPRRSGQNCKFFKFLLSLNSQRRLAYKENNSKYRSLTWKRRSHVRIMIYRTWPIMVCFISYEVIPLLLISRLCPEMPANEIQCTLWLTGYPVMLIIRSMHLIKLHLGTYLWFLRGELSISLMFAPIGPLRHHNLPQEQLYQARQLMKRLNSWRPQKWLAGVHWRHVIIYITLQVLCGRSATVCHYLHYPGP